MRVSRVSAQASPWFLGNPTPAGDAHLHPHLHRHHPWHLSLTVPRPRPRPRRHDRHPHRLLSTLWGRRGALPRSSHDNEAVSVRSRDLPAAGFRMLRWNSKASGHGGTGQPTQGDQPAGRPGAGWQEDDTICTPFTEHPR
jgi:hypothetical protein